MKLDTRTLWGARAGLGFVLMLGCSAGDALEPSLGESGTDPIEEAFRTPRRGPRSPGQGHGRGNGHGHGHGKGGHHHHGPGCGHPPNGGGKGGSGGTGSGSAGSGTGTGAATGVGGSNAGGGGLSSGGSGGSMSAGAGGTFGSGGSTGGSGGSAGGGFGVCGDQIPEWDEQCDDGNEVAGDGCNACMLEPGYICEWGGSCHLVVCGDGVQEGYLNTEGDWVYEECDDSNAASGDGCSASCVIEAGHICDWTGPCHEVICGDGVQESYALGDGNFGYEGCDDANAAAGDGCSDECALEPGFFCPAPGVSCREIECGDGFQDYWWEEVDGGGTGGSGGSGAGSGGTGGGSAGAGGGGYTIFHYEQCDDGNTTSTDGCSDACELEAGWICDVPAEPCRQPTCGDGYIDFIGGGGTSGTGAGGFGGMMGGSYEECDDANEASGDGCDSACTYESGYFCPEPGVPCQLAVCGNGWTEWPAEECDDGNNVPSDGCTACNYDGGWAGAGGTGMGGAGAGTGGTGGTGFGGMMP